MSLNGWQRLGILASFIWAVSSAIYIRNAQVKSAETLLKEKFTTCMNEQDSIAKECLDKFTLQNALDVTANWSDVLLLGLGPIIASWLVAYAVLKVFVWVKAGF